jgi:integrase
MALKLTAEFSRSTSTTSPGNGTRLQGNRSKAHQNSRYRHSHISLLIDMGFTALAIADRVGHESIDITYRYAHLFPVKAD